VEEVADAAAMRQRLLDEPELIGSTIYNEDGTIVWRGDDAPPEAVPLTYRGEGYNAEFVNNGLPSNMVPIGEYVKSFDKNAKVYATKYSNAEVLKNPALSGRTKSVTVELSNGKKVTYPARAEWEPASRVKYEAVIINDRAYIEKSILDKDLGIKVEANNLGSVDIPQDGKLGTSITRMVYTDIKDSTSSQYKLREAARNANPSRYSYSTPEYYAMIDNRILIATKQNIGGTLLVAIGDYVNVEFQANSGKMATYKCIIGDFKGADAPNSWGHNDGRSVVEVIYHSNNPPEGHNSNSKSAGNIGGGPANDGNDPWGYGKVLKITKVGNYGAF